MARKITHVLLMLFLFLMAANPTSAQQKWFTVYYPVWCMVPLGVTGDALPPWEMDWRGITHVVHFFNKNNVDTVNAPYFSPVTVPNDSIEYEFYGIGNPGSGPGSWLKWQDSLNTIAHRNGAKVFVNVQSVDAKWLNAIVKDSVKTEVFVNGVVGYAERKGYDGVEINWENWITPLPSGTTGKNQISRLIRRFRVRLDLSPTVKLLALAPGQSDWTKYDPAATLLVDQVNIQLYGYVYAWYGAIGANASWYVSPLFKGTVPAQFDGLSWDTQGPVQWEGAGHSAARLGVGIPTFGWILKGVDSLYLAVSNCDYGYAKYWDCVDLLTNGGVAGWDDQRKVPYIKGTALATVGPNFCQSSGITVGQKFFATYENAQSLQEKVAWLNTRGYGGVMLYDMTTDLDNSLPLAQRNPLKNALYNALTSIERHGSEIPKGFMLGQNYPNPFNPSTTISFSLPLRTHVTLRVFNSLGQFLTVLADSELEAGNYKIPFDTSTLKGTSSGVYYYQLETPDYKETKRLVLLK